MSTHLLPVGTNRNIPVTYIRLDLKSDTIQSSITCEHDRIIYILSTINNNTIIKIQKFNLMTNEMSLFANLSYSALGHTIGSMLVDDNYVYLRDLYITRISRINKETLTIDSYTHTISDQYDCYGDMAWYDPNDIVCRMKRGFAMFNTKSLSWKTYTDTSSYDSAAMSVGKKIFMKHSVNDTTVSTYIYNYDKATFSTLSLSNTGAPVSCYHDGKFYIAQTNYLYIYDESSGSIEKTLSVPWTRPKSILYSNGYIYALLKNSNLVIAYNIAKSSYRGLMLQWTIPDNSTNCIIRPSIFRNYFFVPYWSLCRIEYSDMSKYKFGSKYNHQIFIYDTKHKNEYTYDDNYITFNDSCMTIHDGVITRNVEVADEEHHIKKISINKSDYTKLKSISFVQKGDENNE